MKTIIEMAREVYGEHTFWTGPQLERLERFAELARAEEREACAKVCETLLGPTATDFYGKPYAAAIRARGQV